MVYMGTYFIYRAFKKTPGSHVLPLGTLLLLLVFIAGCTNPLGDGADGSKVEDQYDVTVPTGINVGTLNSSMDENAPPITLTLPYTSKAGVTPSSCQIESLANITNTSSCLCSAGICTVNLRSNTDTYGRGSFAFRIADNRGILSNLGRAYITIRQVTIASSSGDQQSATVATAVTSPPVAVVRNSDNNPVSGVSVSWRILSGGGQVSSCTSTSDSNGFAQCSWTLGPTAGTQEMEASIFSGQSKTSFTATANPGAAVKLGYSVQPGGGAASLAWSIQPVVLIQDTYGNTVPASSANVTVAIGTNPSSGTLAGTFTAAAVSGAASFAGLSIDKLGTGYTLTASSPGLTSATSSGFDIVAGAPAKLAFTTQPGGGSARSAWAQQPVVTIQDSYGNTATSSATVSVVMGTNPGSGSISGTATLNAVNGVVSFAGLAINKVGTGYTLRAFSSGLTSTTSSAFNITAGVGTQLAFSTQPGGGTAGSAWTQQPVVTIQDAAGNTATSSSASITLSIDTNPGSGNLSGTATVNAINGIATFSGLSINKSSTGYTLSASGSGLTSATSSGFNITAGSATQLVFTTQPSGGSAGNAFTTQPVVVIQDAFGNTVTGGADAGTLLTMDLNSGAGTLSGTKSVAVILGVATWSDLSIDILGSKVLRVSKPDLTISGGSGSITKDSNSFNISTGTAAKLAFSTEPGGGNAGATWSQQPVVTIQDAYGNTVTSSTASVTLAIGTNPGSGTLSGIVTVNAVNGVANFAGLSINRPGTGYTLNASSSSLTGSNSAIFNISAGTGTQLVFSTQPGGGTAGSTWSQQPVITIEDSLGNTVTSSSASITLAIGANPGSGTLSGTVTVNASSGVAIFSGLSINKSGTDYTLTASGTGFTGATSSNFRITAGPATKLIFSTQPGGGTAGIAWTQQPVVTVQDSLGNTVTSSSATIALAIGTNPGTGSLAGTTTVSSTNGIATFSGLSINQTGTGYTLTASSSGLTPDTSSSFNITAGTATKLTFSTQPGGGAAGATWTQQPVVTIQDSLGNTVASSTSITLVIGTNPGSGTLSGTTTVNAINGIAAFAGLSINKSSNGYKLSASGASLTGVTSSTFDITAGTASTLVFSTQPGGGTAGLAWSQQPVLIVQDAFGNTVTTSSASITLVMGTNPGSGSLSGTTTVTASSGVATFSGLSINKSGTGYALTASGSGFSGTGTSSGFNITPGVATQLEFSTQPGGGTAGSSWSQQPVVTIQDAFGNTATSSSVSITLAIGTNPGTGTLSGTSTAAASSGVATFSGLSINKSGTGYTLTASSTGLTLATSSGFNITVGSATRLAFTTQPGGGTAGIAWSQQPLVTVQDALGNTVTSSSASIILSIGTNPGSGVLSGTVTVNAASGVATFAGLSLDKVGTNYTLLASSTGLSGATSSMFSISAGTATQIVFTTQPGGAASSTAFATQPVVTIQDAYGNTVTSGADAGAPLTMSLNSGTGTLSGTTSAIAVLGVATWSGLSIDTVGTKALQARKPDLTGSSGTGAMTANSNSFSIASGPATKLTFSTQPNGGTAGVSWSQQPAVTIQDAAGNTVTSSSVSVTLAIGTNPGSGTLSGTVTMNAVNGVASFSGISLNKPGTGYTLTASSSGLTGATSSFFNIVTGPATKLAFSTQPNGGLAGVSWSQQPVVQIQDAAGNTVTSSSASVVLSFGSNPGAGTLSGTVTVNASSGVATFTNLSINKSGVAYTLSAASSGLTGDTSSGFNITPGTATQIAFITQPGGGTAGTAWTQQPTVNIQDSYGNTVTSSSASVTLAIATNPGAGTLSGTTTLTASNGVVTFTNLLINKSGTGYTLSASSSGLTGTTSSTFDITPGTATKLAFTTQPGGGVAGSSWTQQPVVTIQDASGNTVTSSSASVTLAIGTNPGGGTLSGTATVAASSGVTTFSGFSIDKLGTGYTLTASSSGLTGATSSGFNIASGAATQLAFTTQPNGGTVGSAWSQQPLITVQDAFGNTVSGSSASIALAIGSNPGAGNLSGTTTLNASSGVATFTNLSINKSGTGYTLTASSSGLTGATSSTFNITPGAASQLVFSTQPGGGTAGSAWAQQPVVTIQDSFGNTVTSSSASITIAMGTNPGTGTLSGTASSTAANGVATFSGLSINKSGTGYSLTASSGGLTGATSSGFNITPGVATQLAFSTQPGGGTAGIAWTQQPVVTIQDALGNTVTSSSMNVLLSLGTNPGSGNLSGTATLSASGGVATFSGLSINKSGTGYTLTASSTGLTGTTSSGFNIAAGAATQLVFTTQPAGGSVGGPFATQPTVTIQDAYGNTVINGADGGAPLTISLNSGTGTLSGTTTVTAALGVATWSGLSIDTIGSKVLRVNKPDLTGSGGAGTLTANSSSFSITSGGATKLAFTTQPGGGTADSAWGQQPVIAVQDSFGNTVTSVTASITLIIGTNPGTGTLSGTATVNAINGIATFVGLSINKTGTGYSLTASSSGLTGATSLGFNITPGTATKLAFTTQPGGGAAGAAWAQQPVVTIQDASGNTVTSSSASIALAIGTNPGGGALSATIPIAAANGVTAFSGLFIDKVGTGYTLTASSSGLTGATSSGFNVTPGTATKLAFTTQPGGGTAGSPWAQQPVVTIQDAYSNTVTSSLASVTLVIGTNPGSGSLSGTATLSVSSGVATFSGLFIDKLGAGYTLTASSSGVTGATSSGFNITSGVATRIVFSTQPGGGTAGSSWSQQPVVTIQDALGNRVTSSTASIVLSIGANPSTGTLSGTATLNASSGVASFAGLSINKSGTGYTLTASSSGLTGATSSGFNITVGTATQLVFSIQPGGGTAGSAWAQQPVVTIQDAFGNTVTSSTASIVLSIGTNPSTGTLSGTATLAASSGVATFLGLSINKSGIGYTLTASSSGLTGATSSGFNITIGTATQLVFSPQPGGGTAGSAWAQQPVVTIQDAFGNTVTSSTASIALSIGTNPSAGTLSGTATLAASSGVATFSGLSINKSGAGYTLTASSPGLTGATSSGFNITAGMATQLVFISQPGGGTAGLAWTQQPVVTIQDALGNTVTSSSVSITLAIGTNPGTGSLAGTATTAASSGVATFSGLSINKSGTGYTLAASSSGLTGAASSGFNITPGTATKLVFTTQPGGGIAGLAWTQQPVVTIQDAFDNKVTSSSVSITLALGTNPGSGALSGTGTLNASSGVATFAGLSINKSGVGYTLTASSSGLTGVTSSGFNITAGTATQIVFSSQPGGGTAGIAWTQQPVITIQDALGNTITSSSASITLSIGSNPGAGTLTGTATLAASSGVANFSGLSINKSGIDYTLTASSSGLTGATSTGFDITHGAAAKLVFTTQPGGGTAGSAWSQQPIITIQDTSGNTVTSSTASVVLGIGTNPSAGFLSGTATLAASNGVATFSTLSVDKSGTGYTLTASSSGLTGATSSGFSITAGAATKLAFTTQPGGGTAGSVWSQQPVVTIQDTFGNTVTSSSVSVALAIGTNAGPGSLSGTTTLNASSGVTPFSGLAINRSGTGYTLTASSSGLTGATSSGFNITAGTATKIVFTTQPGGGTAGGAWSQQPAVTVQDNFGNRVTSSSASIVLSISANPGSGTLSGTATLAASSGIATFSGLSIDKVGTGYALTASSSGLTGTTSSGFNIIAGAASKLAFITQPTGGTAGSVWSQQPVIAVQDAFGNTVTSSSVSITVAMGTNPGSGTLSGTATAAAASGVASFTGLSIEKSGTGYTLTASSTGLTGATSSTFNITHSNATQLVFTTQPGGAVAGVAFTTQPVVAIRDAYGNNITGGTDAGAGLTISLSSGTGSLSGTTIIMASLGISSWSGLSIDAFGSKTLQVNKPDLTGSGGTGPLSVTSNSFNNATNPPPIPTGLGANAGDNSVALSWTASSGATSYNILRGTSAGSLTQLATSNTNSYTDSTASNGTIYFYAVQSSSPRGTSGNSSNIQAEPLSTPSISSFAVNDTAGAGALVLSWSASAGASNYQVKYSTTSGSASSGIGGCTVTALTCTVTGLTSGTMYYFSVNATNTYSGSVNSSESSGIPRSVPTLSLTPGHKQITPVFASAGATSFNLSYGTSAGSYSTTVTGAASGTAITGLVNGTVYYFKVVANFSTGGLSSAEISTAPNGPQGFTITSATQGDAKVALVWGSSTGATSYTVKYGTSPNSYGSTFATGVTGTSSTVTGLTNGTTYYFMVAAVNASGSQDASAEFIRTPALPTLSTISSSAYDSANTQVVTSTLASNWSANLGFTLGGLSSFTCNGTVTASSSSTSIVPNSSLTLSGTYPNCTLNVAVTGGTTGSTTITLTATHGSATANRNFVFYILPQATLAYATRLVVLGYTGSALRVRDSTNSAQADVAFDSNGIVSANSTATVTSIGTSGYSVGQTMTFSSFYSTHSLYVVTWYDQSGRGADMTQATAGNQPRIVNAGVIESAGSAPAIRGIGSSQTYMKIAANSVTIGTINSVAQFFSSTPAWGGIYSFRTSNPQHTPATTTAAFGAQIGPTYTVISNHLSSAAAVWVNGTAGSVTSFNTYNIGISYTNNSILTQYLTATTGNLNGTTFEDNCCGNRSLDGTIQEVIFFPAQLSAADRQALEHRQESTYSIVGI